MDVIVSFATDSGFYFDFDAHRGRKFGAENK